jgi:glycerol transport system ATP-binding protein
VIEDGRDVTAADPRGRDVGFVYQQFVNYPSATVFENIAAPLRNRKLPAAEIDAKVRGIAKRLRLDDLLQRLPAQLSGGQQQRTALARALVKEPRLLLLDEPLANLDYKLREELREELKELVARPGRIVVYATSEPQEALILGGRVSIVHEGRILQSGPTGEVFRRPVTEDAARVFSDPEINVVPGSITGGSVRLSAEVSLPRGRHLAALPEGPYRIGIRAEHLRVQAGAGTVRIPARLELEEVTGSDTRIHAVHEGLPLLALEDGVHRHERGKPLDLHLDPERVLAFDPTGRLVAAPDGAR